MVTGRSLLRSLFQPPPQSQMATKGMSGQPWICPAKSCNSPSTASPSLLCDLLPGCTALQVRAFPNIHPEPPKQNKKPKTEQTNNHQKNPPPNKAKQNKKNP